MKKRNRRPFFEAVYDVLIEHAGAPADPDRKEAFVEAYSSQGQYDAIEWRVCPRLGFGGKFWQNHNHYYVSYYPEDRSDERDALRDEINRLIEKLVERFDEWGVLITSKTHTSSGIWMTDGPIAWFGSRAEAEKLRDERARDYTYLHYQVRKRDPYPGYSVEDDG
jgi:hypothetical protein